MKSKEAISDDDMTKLNEYFMKIMHSRPSTHNLQQMVLFYIIFYFGRCGRENLCKMTKQTFQLAKDTEGREYIITS